MSKFQIYCSCIKCKLPTTLQNLSRHYDTHNNQLSVCLTCSALTKNQKFCSSSCSAIYNNKNRTEETKIKRKNTWLAKCKPKIAKIKIPRKPKQRICIRCGRLDETFGHFQSDKCMFCNDSLTYRDACKFTFNIKNYPDEFDLTLLTTFGMFNPKTNQEGVSKDHMLSISYGKLHQIDPIVMAHPANCNLITQSKNKAKQHNSSITLAELHLRIAAWNLKYGSR